MALREITYEQWVEEASVCDECVDPQHYDGFQCYKHKMLFWQIKGAPGLPPSVKPKHIKEQPFRRPEPNNAWERGIKRDERGIPILGSKGQPMRMKEYSERRHEVDARVKELKTSPNPFKK